MTSSTTAGQRKPTLAVWKFASCDGCQLTLLNCEDELLAITDAIQVANFTEASREVMAGPYDLSLVEGSITTPHDAERIREVRQASRFLVTIGACATAGGIQALRNFSDVTTSRRWCTPRPPTSTRCARPPRSPTTCRVDFELRGCPIDRRQLLEVISAYLRRPQAADPRAQRVHRVQARRDHLRDGGARDALPRPGDAGRLRRAVPVLRPGLLRLLRADGDTEHRRACRALARARRGRSGDLVRAFRAFTAGAEPFRKEAEAHDHGGPADRSRCPRSPGSRARAAWRSSTEHGQVTEAQAGHLRAAPVLRGAAARPTVHRAAGHHRADLRHLPGRLPDERVPGHRGRLRRHRARAGRPRCAGCCTAASGSRATCCTSTCCTRPDFLGYESGIHLARDHPEIAAARACG